MKVNYPYICFSIDDLVRCQSDITTSGACFPLSAQKKKVVLSRIIIIRFLVLLEQAYLLNSPNVVNCNDNLSSSDKSHSALRTT